MTAREDDYIEGYMEYPPLLVGGVEQFSPVAHRTALSNVANNAIIEAFVDAALAARAEGDIKLAIWLVERAEKYRIGQLSVAYAA
jgi:hypothetical protein